MGRFEDKILDILRSDELNEDVSWETVGGPSPSATLKGPLDYTKPVTKATVPQAHKIPGVGEFGDDDADKNGPITAVVDDMDEDEDMDDADDEKDEKDGDKKDKGLDETFAQLLARLAEEDEGETSLHDDNGGEPDETLPDVDSKLNSPDKLVNKAPGIKVAEEEEEEEGETSLHDDNGGEPDETLPDVDSMLDTPDKLVTPAVGAKTPNKQFESEDDDMDDDDMDDDDEKKKDKDVQEDISAIFAGVKLSESAKKKALTIFQAAVTRRVNEEKTRVQKVATKKLKEAFAVLKARSESKQQVFESALVGKVDNYLNYVVENWMSDNRLAVERGIRTELTESFISRMRDVFVEHYIEVPESKVDVLATLGKKVTSLESKLNEAVEVNVKMRSSLNTYRKEEVIRAVSNDLVDTQREKLKKLSEGVEYTTRKEFAEKLKSLKESYFPKKTTAVRREEQPLVESVQKPAANSEMSVYSQMISKMKKNS